MKKLAIVVVGTAQFLMAAEEGIKINALAQAWMFNDTSVTIAKPNFRLRRAELKVSGNLGDQVKAFLMLDGAKSLSTTSTTVSTPTSTATVNGLNTSADNKIIQDLGVTIMPIENFDITLGQVKTPTTQEGMDSSGELLFPERSIVGRTYGDKREPGIVLGYKYEKVKGILMVSNGQATNVDDIDNNKDLTFRLNVDVTKEISAGAFTQAANFSYGERARHGVNIKYQTEEVIVRAEGAMQSLNQDTLKSNGIMVDGGYKFGNWQPVVRIEMYKADTTADQTGKAFSLGLNYLFTSKAKVQFATTAFWDLNANNGALAFSTAAKDTAGTLMTLAFSAAM